MGSLTLKKYSISRGDTLIMQDASLEVKAGELHVIRGANGVGKSSFLLSLIADEQIKTDGEMVLDGVDCKELQTHERAKLGLFLAFQDVPAFPGMTIESLVKAAYEARNPDRSVVDFFDMLRQITKELGLDPDFTNRQIVGLSGGQKKRLELMLMKAMRPSVVLLDEIDAGLDQDGRQIVLQAIATARAEGVAFVVVTHQEDFITAINPTRIWHVQKKRLI